MAVPTRRRFLSLLGVGVTGTVAGCRENSSPGTAGEEVRESGRSPPPQAADIVWHQTVGGDGDDTVWDAIRTSDGSYLLAGESDSWTDELWEGWLVKITPEGRELWSKTYNQDRDNIKSVAETSDGGYAVTGDGRDSGWVAVLDATGTPQWMETYPDFIAGDAIVESADDKIVVAGPTESESASTTVLKVRSAGELVWETTDHPVRLDHVHDLHQTPDGGALLFADSREGPGGWGAVVLKFDAGGTLAWSEMYGGSGLNEPRGVLELDDGGYLLYGRVFPDETEPPRVWLVKISADGTKAWSHTYTEGEIVSAVRTSETAMVLLIKRYRSGAPAESALVEMNAAGEKTSEYTFMGADFRPVSVLDVAAEEWTVVGMKDDDAHVLRVGVDG